MGGPDLSLLISGLESSGMGARSEQSVAGGARDALEALSRGEAALAVVDMTVDGMRGAEGWRLARDSWRGPIIVVCANSDKDGLRAALADGAEDALVRDDPSTPQMLRHAIARALARGRDSRPEERLRALQARWEALDTASHWYVMEIDADDRITYLNRMAPGAPAVTVRGKSVYEFTHPDARADVRTRLAHVRSTGEAVTVEERGYGTVGEDAWFVARCLPVKRDGRVVAILVVTEDVSERRRMQQLVANSERRFRALIEKSSDAIVLLD